MLNKASILILSIVSGVLFLSCGSTYENNESTLSENSKKDYLEKKEIIVGAKQLNQYLPLLEGKKIGLIVNHSSFIDTSHLVDVLIENNVKVVKIFAPEHGFRGKADAGEQVKDGVDIKTGLPIVSLYGKNKKPLPEQIVDLDVLVFDIQDVGARFYTYISTMHYVMEAAAESNKKMIVLDRPNPNGHYVDGPILDTNFQSFVGMHSIPIVHGMTVGELALMINGEKWLKNHVQCDLKVIKCQHYDHKTFYNLPIKPSPNLPNMGSIYLYPSLCLFEGTKVSVGRGTTKPFLQIGIPQSTTYNYSFVPQPNEGAKHPKHEGKACEGIDFSPLPLDSLRNTKFSIKWLVEFYQLTNNKEDFFNNFFNKLAGNSDLKEQIINGYTIEEIRSSWDEPLKEFKQKRKQYLLYPDFE